MSKEKEPGHDHETKVKHETRKEARLHAKRHKREFGDKVRACKCNIC